jgi:hypothetical protein
MHVPVLVWFFHGLDFVVPNLFDRVGLDLLERTPMFVEIRSCYAFEGAHQAG